MKHAHLKVTEINTIPICECVYMHALNLYIQQQIHSCVACVINLTTIIIIANKKLN